MRASFNQIRISKSALCHNYHLLKEQVGNNVRLLAMIKADAYGHGMNEVARVLSDAGCPEFGVAEIEEGVRLRDSGIEEPIFIFLGFDPLDVDLFFEYNLTPVIYTLESAQTLSLEAEKRNREVEVHVKIDCGMTRLGIYPEEFEQFYNSIKELPGLVFGGIASHFPRSDEADSNNTLEQFSRFEKLFAIVDKNENIIRHTANSGGILYFPRTHCDMVRAGISLYGYYPDGITGSRQEEGAKLKPVMSFSTRVLQVKAVPAGTGISYGHTYITDSETRIAVLPVGYEDGLSRSLSNKGEVLIRGKRAKIRGRICMNLCMVDVTLIEDVQAGDEVVILGSQYTDTISADEIAGWMSSISYEVLCLFGNNNERKYIE
ncbi:MAG: alanine racemase [Desulfocapsa sp.]|nr:alanine racemase [Desulfocapsa sp.]